jgi:hypothetical protein
MSAKRDPVLLRTSEKLRKREEEQGLQAAEKEESARPGSMHRQLGLVPIDQF